MVAQTSGPPEKQHLPELSRMGICEWQLKPALRHLTLQRTTVALRLFAASRFITVISDRYSLDLQLP